MIDFLGTKDFSARTVLEFGSGQSTLWWAKRSKRVLSFESDPEWHSYVQSNSPSNAEIVLISKDLTGLEKSLHDEKFDVIIIDGLDRCKAASWALELLQEGGAILVDNTQVKWGGEATTEYPLLNIFRSAGFNRVDFYGYVPAGILTNCTSLFFKDWYFAIRGGENVVWNKLPVG